MDSFYIISFLHFPENDCFFDGLLTLLRKCLCIQWLKIVLTSIQWLQTAFSDLPNYLHKPSNCKNVIRLRKNSLFKASTDCTRKQHTLLVDGTARIIYY